MLLCLLCHFRWAEVIDCSAKLHCKFRNSELHEMHMGIVYIKPNRPIYESMASPVQCQAFTWTNTDLLSMGNIMMTSSNGSIFRVTGPLCGEFTGHRWIPRTKASDAEFDVFFDLRLNIRASKQSQGWWFETPSRSLWCHSNDALPSSAIREPVKFIFDVTVERTLWKWLNIHSQILLISKIQKSITDQIR